MNEFLVTYRDNNTNALIPVHIVNVEDEHQAHVLADNSLLDETSVSFMFTQEITDPDLFDIPF